MNIPHEESTYALIVQYESEDKGRGVLETVLYAFFILSVAFSIWQFGLHPVIIPAAGLKGSSGVASEMANGQELSRS